MNTKEYKSLDSQERMKVKLDKLCSGYFGARFPELRRMYTVEDARRMCRKAWGK